MTEAQKVEAPSARGRRILVVATSDVVPRSVVGSLGAGAAPVIHVVAPMLHSPLRFYTNDDRSRRRAQARLAIWLAALETSGIEADGEVGDDDPVQAIEDGVAVFEPDEVVVVTSPDADAAWLERGAVDVARTRIAVPLVHLIAADGGAEPGTAAPAGSREQGDHATRELLLLIVTGLLAMMGSGFWFLGGSVLPTEKLVLYAIAVDIVPKALFVYLLWRFWLGRGHARRS